MVNRQTAPARGVAKGVGLREGSSRLQQCHKVEYLVLDSDMHRAVGAGLGGGGEDLVDGDGHLVGHNRFPFFFSQIRLFTQIYTGTGDSAIAVLLRKSGVQPKRAPIWRRLAPWEGDTLVSWQDPAANKGARCLI